MPIAVQCPSCRKEYQVKDQLGGQTVRCMACQKPMVIPQPATLPAAAVVGAVGQPAGTGKAIKSPAISPEFTQYGLEGPIQRTPDLFGTPIPASAPDPLANHVVMDPGFGSSEYIPAKKEVLNLAYQRVSDDSEPTEKDASTKASNMMSIGITILIFGIGVFVLPFLGLEWSFLSEVPDEVQWGLGVVAGVGGLVMIGIGAASKS